MGISDTIKGNLLIAEFMGLENVTEFMAEYTMKYWHEWDALMPVVGKIRSNDFVDTFTIDMFDKIELSGNWNKNKFFFEKRCNLCGIETVRQSLYVVCVGFIEWYNENSI